MEWYRRPNSGIPRADLFRGSERGGQLWDVLKDSEGFANGLFASIAKLRAALRPGLRRYWENAALVLSLVGRPWLHDQANTSAKS